MKKYISFLALTVFAYLFFCDREEETEDSGLFHFTEEEYRKAEKLLDSIKKEEQETFYEPERSNGPHNKSFEYNFVLNHVKLSYGGDFDNAQRSQHTVQVKDDRVVIKDGNQQQLFKIVSAPRKDFDANLGEYTFFEVIAESGSRQRLLFYKDYYYGVVQVVSRNKIIWYIN